MSYQLKYSCCSKCFLPTADDHLKVVYSNFINTQLCKWSDANWKVGEDQQKRVSIKNVS